jgi:hypothetical protein
MNDEGTVTVEYAVIMVVAAVIAGIAYAIAEGDQVRAWVTDLIQRALTMT